MKKEEKISELVCAPQQIYKYSATILLSFPYKPSSQDNPLRINLIEQYCQGGVCEYETLTRPELTQTIMRGEERLHPFICIRTH
jgi:hypothetical protein